MTSRWRDHVGPGEDRHIKFREDKDLDDAILRDDMNNLEKLLPRTVAKDIKKRVDREIQEAIDFSEKSAFPSVTEIMDNVYE